jgi:hypothetical protein
VLFKTKGREPFRDIIHDNIRRYQTVNWKILRLTTGLEFRLPKAVYQFVGNSPYDPFMGTDGL